MRSFISWNCLLFGIVLAGKQVCVYGFKQSLIRAGEDDLERVVPRIHKPYCSSDNNVGLKWTTGTKSIRGPGVKWIQMHKLIFKIDYTSWNRRNGT